MYLFIYLFKLESIYSTLSLLVQGLNKARLEDSFICNIDPFIWSAAGNTGQYQYAFYNLTVLLSSLMKTPECQVCVNV